MSSLYKICYDWAIILHVKNVELLANELDKIIKVLFMNTSTRIDNRKQRDSNMELLRIISMLLVLIVHANFRALPLPTVEEANTEVLSTLLRFFTESFSIICVNSFVILSGWYGINFKIKKISELLFQVLFFSLFSFSIYLFFVPSAKIGIKEVATLLMLNSSDYWFVKSYVGLYILSPLLNSFVKSATQKQFKTFLISFYIFQLVYAWMSPNGAIYFAQGYSAFSFIGLYMLARYIRLYPVKIWILNKFFDLFIYAFFVIFTTFIVFLLRKYDFPGVGHFYLYTSPFVIIASIHFVLFFSKFSISNKVINWFSASCFAVYLLHSNPLLASPCYDKVILEWFMEMNCIHFLGHVIPFIIGVFILSILIDKMRIYLWNKI